MAEESSLSGAPAEAPAEAPVGTEAAEAAKSPAAWSFQYGGRTFNSPEEASQYFNSWNGRLKASDRQLQEALRVVNEWDQWYQTHRDRIEGALKGGQEKAEGSKDLLTGVDWDHIKSLIDEGRGLEAIQFLQYQTGESFKQALADVRREISTSLAPLQEQQAARDMAVSIMTAAQQAVDPESGEALYPEFQEGSATYNPDFVRYFGQVWRQLPAQVAYDPQLAGVDLAYLKARQVWDRHLPASQAAGQAVENARGRIVQQAAAQATAIGGSGSKEPGEGSPLSRVKQQLRDAQRYNPKFGVWD